MKPTYEELETELAETKTELAETKMELAEAKELLKQTLERIADLKEQLKLNSKNSSKPPSTDNKANSPDRERKRRESREGKSRIPFSADRVDHHVECTRNNCAHCGSDAISLLDIIPETLQQVELPEVRAIVTEYLLQKYKCSSCGKRSVAKLPDGVPDSVFGPRTMALFATLTGVFHLAKREAIQLIKDLYDIDIGLGSSSNIEERVANALNPVCQRIHNVLLDSPFCKHFDETGWRTNGKRRFVWVASNEVAAYYLVDPSRSREAFERLIKGETSSLEKVVTDRYGVYSPIGEALAKELAKACQIHGEYREGNITKKARNIRLGHLKRRVQYWLEDGHANGMNKFSRMCDTLLGNFDKLWTFTKLDGMEPTNNLAERDLRKLVIWRKKSYGTRSMRGEKFVAKITSVAETVKRHGKNILYFVEQAVSDFYENKPPLQICASLGL